MATSLALVRDVYRLWRRPALSRLPYDSVFMILQDEALMLAQTLEESSTQTLLVAIDFNPASTDVVLPTDQAYGLPRALEARLMSADPTEPWTPIEIIPYRDYETRLELDMDVATIYGSPPRIKLSQDVADRDFQLFYPLLLAVPANLNASPNLDVAWQTYLKYRVALRVGTLIEGDISWREANMTSLADARDTWKKLFDTHTERDNPEATYPTPLIEGIYDLWRKPSYKRLPLDRVFRILQDEAKALSQGLALSNQAQSIAKVPMPTSAQDVLLQVPSLQLPTAVKVRPRGSTPETPWGEIDIVSFRSFSKRQAAGGDVVTFYGTPPHALFAQNVQGRQIELWYPMLLPTPKVIDENPAIDEAWWTLLKYATAVSVGPKIIDNAPPVITQPADMRRPVLSPWRTFYKDNMVSLVETRDKWEKMFKKYTERDNAELSYRTGFNDRSDSSGSITWPRA